MTPREHEDGMRQEPTLSAAEKAEGFAAVMRRLKGHSREERVRLRTQAEEVVLGYEAYALGQEYFDRSDYDAARRWFRMAAGHHVPGAAQALEEIALRQTFDGFMDVAAVAGHQHPAGTVPCETIPSPDASRAKDGQHRFPGGVAWTSVVEQLCPDQTVAAVRARAGQITAQARREADAILAEARQQADRTAAACAEMVLEVERDRQQADELLAEARQEAESVRSEIAEAARRSTDEMLAKAQQQALLILDNARDEAAQIRSRARRQDSASNRASTQAEANSVREFHGYFAVSLMKCTPPPAGYMIDELFVDPQDGSVRRPPATVADDPDFRRRFGRKITAARRVRGTYTAGPIDADPDGVPPWLSTLSVPGPSLTEAVTRRGPVPAMQWLVEVVEALQAIHAEGMVHRDIKPSNVLLPADGCRVIDFGIALAADGTSVLREGDAPGGSEQPSTASARKNVLYAAVRCPDDMLRFERANRACSATPEAAWQEQDGPRVSLGIVKADEGHASDDAELGVEGAGNSAGR